jgi:hypothetical protein
VAFSPNVDAIQEFDVICSGTSEPPSLPIPSLVANFEIIAKAKIQYVPKSALQKWTIRRAGNLQDRRGIFLRTEANAGVAGRHVFW